jgi:hypothetical protein
MKRHLSQSQEILQHKKNRVYVKDTLLVGRSQPRVHREWSDTQKMSPREHLVHPKSLVLYESVRYFSHSKFYQLTLRRLPRRQSSKNDRERWLMDDTLKLARPLGIIVGANGIDTELLTTTRCVMRRGFFSGRGLIYSFSPTV